MNKVIVTVDLGHFKAYRVTKNQGESARADLLESYDILDTHGKLMTKVTDAEGSFNRGTGGQTIAKGSGEPRTLKLETEKKVISRIVNDINSLVKKEDPSEWYLAAAERINNKIVKNLEPSIKAKLDKSITSDLTKTAKSKILGHFEGGKNA